MAIKKQLGALALSVMMAGPTIVPAKTLAQNKGVIDLNTQPTITMVEKSQNGETIDPQDAAMLNKLTPSQRAMYDKTTYHELRAMNIDPQDAASLNNLTPDQRAMYESRVYQELQAMNLPLVDPQDGATLNELSPEELAVYNADMDPVAKKSNKK